jgi:hypothetical protein
MTVLPAQSASARRPLTHDDLHASRLNPDGSLPVELQSLAIE